MAMTTTDFIRNAIKIHGDKYCYEKSLYTNTRSKVVITCPVHGDFYKSPHNHVSKKQGCPSCSKEKKPHNYLYRVTPTNLSLPINSVAIPLTKGKYAIVDEDKADDVLKISWHTNTHGYAAGWLDRSTRVLMHRLIMSENDTSMVIDHINGNRLDNRACNLRRCTVKQNSRNRSACCGSSSKYKGVSLKGNTNKWEAGVCVDGRNIKLGIFESELEAAKAYDKAAVQYFGEFAKLNF